MTDTDYAVGIEEYLAEYLTEHLVSREQMAEALDVSLEGLMAFMTVGTDGMPRQILPALYAALERATGMKALAWQNLDDLYRADIARLGIPSRFHPSMRKEAT